MKVQKINGRTIATHNGLPVRAKIVTREAMTAPKGTRMKAALVLDCANDDGSKSIVPLPFATATIGVGQTSKGKDKTPNGYTPEFRLEMN